MIGTCPRVYYLTMCCISSVNYIWFNSFSFVLLQSMQGVVTFYDTGFLNFVYFLIIVFCWLCVNTYIVFVDDFRLE